MDHRWAGARLVGRAARSGLRSGARDDGDRGGAGGWASSGHASDAAQDRLVGRRRPDGAVRRTRPETSPPRT